MQAKFLILVALVLIVIAAVFFFQPRQTITQTQQPAQQSAQQTQTSTQTTQQPVVKEFTVHGSSFKFNPNSITINKGDTVKITFISDDTTHDLCVEGGYGCTKVVSNGGSDKLEFTAKETANLKFYCSVDGHRLFGMEGDFKIQ